MACILFWIESVVYPTFTLSLSDLIGRDMIRRGWWFHQANPKVTSPMQWEPPKDWLDDSNNEAFDWFFKDINLEKLQKDGIYDFVKLWAEKL